MLFWRKVVFTLTLNNNTSSVNLALDKENMFNIS